MVNRTGRLRRIPMRAIDRRLRGHSLRGTDDANPAVIFAIEFARNSHVGSAEIDLLEAIHKAGSLSQAARDLRISYKHVHKLVTDSDKKSRALRRPQRTARHLPYYFNSRQYHSAPPLLEGCRQSPNR
jgi:hypothetical protein